MVSDFGYILGQSYSWGLWTKHHWGAHILGGLLIRQSLSLSRICASVWLRSILSDNFAHPHFVIATSMSRKSCIANGYRLPDNFEEQWPQQRGSWRVRSVWSLECYANMIHDILHIWSYFADMVYYIYDHIMLTWYITYMIILFWHDILHIWSYYANMMYYTYGHIMLTWYIGIYGHIMLTWCITHVVILCWHDILEYMIILC
jgi:hypothetical protein